MVSMPSAGGAPALWPGPATMDLAFVLAFLLHNVRYGGEEFEADTFVRMQQRQLFLQEQMTRQLQEIERLSQEQSGTDVPALLFAALPSWQFGALAAALVMLLVLIRLLRKMRRLLNVKAGGEKEEVATAEEEDPRDVSFSSWQPTCRSVQELVDELLSVCQASPRSDFMLRLQMSEGVSKASEDNGVRGGNTYGVFVPVRPPPTHIFRLEEDPEGKSGEKALRIRVQLNCTCLREQLLGDMPCFLHNRAKKLKTEEMPSLLDTLCTDSYLDRQKTAAWFQELVTEAWKYTPQSSTVRLEVLPSTYLCKLRLTTAPSRVLDIELILGLPLDDEDSFLILE
ncbi:inositol 1,4,5-trisphosphate receptor-interacting protein-like 1 [Numida meleagris]|uniref:inositol 1,4,5-trisphosphate receptor-interacting protein-like 1 n=1 Tax=Numida meleagris TaxID=8996 RepID=UPI000B3DBCC7|nr:inositol 1,4,5-trisphosphate receptor-interacting protein-like 1 [Numida meleagris]